MPELPEVQTVVDYLKPEIENSKILNCKIFDKYTRHLSGHSIHQLNKLLKGKRIIEIRRRAKYIIFELDQGFLTFHLRMTGQFQINKTVPAHTRFSLRLKQNRKELNLHFIDIRRFGTIKYSENLNYIEEKVGIEPLSKNFNHQYLNKILLKSNRQCKALLLDQKQIAGLGNIYVDEALWSAGIHPQKLSRKVSEQQCKILCSSIKKILRSSIKHQGTTFINFYFAESKSGNFKNKLKVFSKTGEPCPRCSDKIIKIRAAGRGTHLCPKCQKI